MYADETLALVLIDMGYILVARRHRLSKTRQRSKRLNSKVASVHLKRVEDSAIEFIVESLIS